MPRLTIHTKNDITFDVDEGCFCCLGRDDCDMDEIEEKYRWAYRLEHGDSPTGDQCWYHPESEAEYLSLHLRSLHTYDESEGSIDFMKPILDYLMNESPWQDAFLDKDVDEVCRTRHVKLDPDVAGEYVVNAGSMVRRAFCIYERFNQYMDDGATAAEAMLTCIIHHMYGGDGLATIGDGYDDESVINIQNWSWATIRSFLDGTLRPFSQEYGTWNDDRGYPQNVLDQWCDGSKDEDKWLSRDIMNTSRLSLNSNNIIHDTYGRPVDNDDDARREIAKAQVNLDDKGAQLLGFHTNPTYRVERGMFNNYFIATSRNSRDPIQTLVTLQELQHG